MKKIQIPKWPIFLITIIFVNSFSLICTHQRVVQISSYSVLARVGKPVHQSIQKLTIIDPNTPKDPFLLLIYFELTWTQHEALCPAGCLSVDFS